MQVGWHYWTEMVNVSAFALFVGDFPWVLLKGFWLCNQSSKDMIMTMWLHLWPIKTCEKLSSQIGLSAGSCRNSLFPSRIKMAAMALCFVAEPTKDLILHDISLIMCNRATGSYTDPHDYCQWRLSVTTGRLLRKMNTWANCNLTHIKRKHVWGESKCGICFFFLSLAHSLPTWWALSALLQPATMGPSMMTIMNCQKFRLTPGTNLKKQTL